MDKPTSGTFTACDGTINRLGCCDKCYQPAQTSSNYCGRLIPMTDKPTSEKDVIKELKENLRTLPDQSPDNRVLITTIDAKTVSDLLAKIKELEAENERLKEEATVIFHDFDEKLSALELEIGILKSNNNELAIESQDREAKLDTVREYCEHKERVWKKTMREILDLIK